MNILKSGLLLSVIGLTACGDIPRDPDHTTKRIARSHTIKAGIVSASDPKDTAVIIKRIESVTGAKVSAVHSEASLLTDQLEKGRIDLIIGSFAKNSPLKKSVTFSAPIDNRKVASDQPVTRAGMSPGENRWIILVEKAVRGHD